MAGLFFDSLKNIDISVADVLAEASEAAGYSLFVGLVTIDQLDETYCDEEYDCDCNSYAIEHMVAPDGRAANFRKLLFSREEALQDEALRYLCLDSLNVVDQPPHEDEYMIHDITTFERAEKEHAYHLAAFVLWPKKNSLELIASYDIQGAFGYAQTLIENGYKYPAGWKSYAEGYVDGLIAHGTPDTHALASWIHSIWHE